MVLATRTKSYYLPWAGETKELRIPADRVATDIVFHDFPALPDPAAAIVRAMDNPIGTPPLREIVRPGCTVALLTGDRMTDRMLGSRDGLGHVILDYLNAAGVPDENVTFVFAPGTHPHRNADEKIGPALINRVGRYLKHHADRDEEMTFIGYTSRGNAVWINKFVAECDVIVGFGEISPNAHGGWTGGGKMILPGVAGQDTVEHNHRNLIRDVIPLGLADSNPLRLDMEEAARRAGLDFKIDVLVNSREQIVDVYAGDFVQEHRAALPKAREIWMTKMEPTDIGCFYPNDLRERTLESAFFNSITAVDLATKPAGVIIACLSAADGFSKGPGMPYSATLTSRDLFKLPAVEIARDMMRGGGNCRTGSIHYATKRVLDSKRVLLVCDGIDPVEASEFGFAGCYRSFDEALGRAIEETGQGATVSTNFPLGICWRTMPWREG